MDNISHSLAGLALGELVERSLPADTDPLRARVRHRLLLVSCWAASNFPDLDLLLTPLAPRPLGYLLQHRGHTHTLVGLLPQAVLLLAAIWLLWPAARTLLRSSPVTRGGLLAAVAGGLLLHIGMDYLNVYGVHPFYPFDNRWVYGDLVFIVEPAFWVAFGVPLAMLAGRRARWLWLGLLALVLAGFMLRDYLEWWSLAGLAAGGLLLAVVQAWATGRSRRGLAAGWALLGVFLGGQLVAEREARALVMQQAGDGRLLDVALSAFPANPVCWSLVTVAQDDDGQQMVLRRGLLSLLPGLVPAYACPSPIGGTTSRAAPSEGIAWQWTQSVPLARLRSLHQQDCAVDAWLRFARAPSLQGERATDLRFGPPGAPNFSTLQLSSVKRCSFNVPPWDYPRADVLGVAAH
ncbi:hypothetical protein GCM10027321_46650 [Massilia terrae]|uniref:Metal-dependent hydrolase n=1 Tax=Massilia terrae TaxID=1811224 RepID=A0ABT2CSD9_9BURK|nr:metal-dependent hydrolase [Massilia terrae]MCS0656897.1 metal-dependent hydrolase [Massilia terrae]